MSEAAPVSLIKKLIAVYEAVDHVEKRGYNKFQDYEYMRASDIARAIREALRQQEVYATPTFKIERFYTIPAREGEMQAVDVSCQVIFTQESGEQVTVNGFGTGTDKGDKAIYKAQTGALKYALRNGFLVPDQSDPEADETVDRETTVPKSERPQSIQSRPPAPKPAKSTLGATPNTTSTAIGSPQTNATAPARPESHPTPAESAKKEASPAVSATSDDPKRLPTKAEYDGFIERARSVVRALEKAGLSSGKGTPALAKFRNYICRTFKVAKPEELQVGMWQSILGTFDKHLGTAAGTQEAAKLVEAASEKEK